MAALASGTDERDTPVVGGHGLARHHALEQAAELGLARVLAGAVAVVPVLSRNGVPAVGGPGRSATSLAEPDDHRVGADSGLESLGPALHDHAGRCR